MSNPTANPLGAGGDLSTAAQSMKGMNLFSEPQGQPETPEAPVQEANPAPETAPEQDSTDEPKGPVRDPQTGRFRPREPETEDAQAASEEEPPKPEGADAEPEGEQSGQDEPDAEEYETLPETLDGLAEALGLEPGDLLQSMRAKVKVNGEEQEVTLNDLRNGYQMEADYRRKTAEHAERLREFEEQQSALEKQREHLTSQLEPLVTTLQQAVNQDDAVLQQLADQGLWDDYNAYKHHAETRKRQLEQAEVEKRQAQAEAQMQAQQQYQNAIAENEKRLMELRPEWQKDPETGKKRISEIRQYLKSEGVPPQMADTLYDAVSIVTAEKAMLWDEFQKKKKPEALKKAARAKTPFLKPGPSKQAERPEVKVSRANLNRFRKSGHWRDAAAVLKDRNVLS